MKNNETVEREPIVDEIHAPSVERAIAAIELEADRHNAYGIEGPEYKVLTRVVAALRELMKEKGRD